MRGRGVDVQTCGMMDLLDLDVVKSSAGRTFQTRG